MKTIFIVISQGILMRNILRSGGFNLLEKNGHRLVVFINCKEIPEYIQKEFGGEGVFLFPARNIGKPISKIHRFFIYLTHFILWNHTTRRYFRFGKQHCKKPTIAKLLNLLLLRAVSVIPFLGRIIRWLEVHAFQEKDEQITSYFDKFQPDLVFTTSILSRIDITFMKEARRRGITTVSMPKTWDNVTRLYFRFVPDYSLIQNEILKECLVELQDFPEDTIYLTGFPQFDWYSRKDILKTREEHFRSMGLDPSRPAIFFGSQGQWFMDEYRIPELIHEWMEKNELAKPCQMIVRPSFKNVKDTPLARLKGKKDVVFDDSYEISDSFLDNWDPTTSETAHFTNTITHSDMVINIVSTLALDAACADTPVVNVLFGAKYIKGKDVTPLMRFTEHYQWVLDTEGTAVARTPEELKEWINRYLENPAIKAEEREVLRNRLCYKVDGRSSERMVDAIEEILKNNPNNPNN